MNHFKKKTLGFTMIELLVVIGIITTLLGMTTVGVLKIITSTIKETSMTLLISDLKSQQLKSMIGDTEGRGTSDTYGIYVENDKYTLFHGSVFSSLDSANYSVPLEDGFSYSSTLPNNTVIFESGSGEILNFVGGQNTITVSHASGSDSKAIEINALGVVISD